MHKEENSTDPGAHFSDVWADAQRSRSALFKSLIPSSTDFGTNLCDVWADAQSEVRSESRKLRGVIFRSLLLKAWRRLVRKAAPDNRPGSAFQQG